MKSKSNAINTLQTLILLPGLLFAMFIVSGCAKDLVYHPSTILELKSANREGLESFFFPDIVKQMDNNYNSWSGEIKVVRDSLLLANDTCIIFYFVVECEESGIKEMVCQFNSDSENLQEGEVVTYKCIGGCGPNGCAMRMTIMPYSISCDCADPEYFGVCGLEMTTEKRPSN